MSRSGMNTVEKSRSSASLTSASTGGTTTAASWSADGGEEHPPTQAHIRSATRAPRATSWEYHGAVQRRTGRRTQEILIRNTRAGHPSWWTRSSVGSPNCLSPASCFSPWGGPGTSLAARCLMFMRAVALVVLLAGSAAAAAGLSGTHGRDVIEVAHRVEVAVDGRVVRVRDARRIENRDGGAEEAVLAVDVVERGAAVGMRARMGGGWAQGQVMAMEAASERYEALTTGGAPGGRRGPALLAWTTPGELELAAFPLRRGRPLDVEIDAVAAPCAVDGLAVVYLPVVEQGGALAVPALRVRGARSWVVRAGAAAPPALEARWSRLVERCPSDRFGDRADAVVWEIGGTGAVRAGLARMDLASG